MNGKKSDLNPSQDFVHLRMHFQTHLDIVKPSDKRVDSLVQLAVEFLGLTHVSPSQLYQLLYQKSVITMRMSLVELTE